MVTLKAVAEGVSRIQAGASDMFEGITNIIQGDGYFEFVTPDGMTFNIKGEELSSNVEKIVSAEAQAISEGSAEDAEFIQSRAPRKPVSDIESKAINDDGSITYIKLLNGNEVSVTYSKAGYADFSPFEYKGTDGLAEVQIKYSGNRVIDFSNANKAAGFSHTPEGYTWHHVEDEKTMILVRTDIHKLFPHTGGFSLFKAGVPGIVN